MEDGELETSNIQPINVDSFIDDLLKSSTKCTHTHTCHTPSHDSAHTHTCFHSHTQLVASPVQPDRPGSRSGTPLGNREAVRKYREKKKARVAYLEAEIEKLRAVNKLLERRLRRQANLEAEFSRLRGLVADLRGKIDHELRAFPSKKQCIASGSLSGKS